MLGALWLPLLTLIVVVDSLPQHHARHSHIGPQILLRTGAIDVSAQPRFYRGAAHRRHALESNSLHAHPSWGILAGRQQLLVTLKPGLEDEARKAVVDAIRTAGGYMGGYLPENTLLVLGNDVVVKTLQDFNGVLWLGDFEAKHKLDPDLQALCGLIEEYGAQQLEDAVKHQLFPGNLTSSQLRIARGVAFSTSRSAFSVPIVVSFPMTTVFHSSGTSELAQAATAAVSQWGPTLATDFSADVQPAGPRRVTVMAPASNLKAVVQWLAEHPSVHWLSPKYGVALHNYEAAAIIQSGQSASDKALTDAGTHPIWAAGLTGAGQVVGCGDSGAELDHCFFADPKVDLMSNAAWQTNEQYGFPVYNDTNHRKFRLYFAVADRTDSNGHGTHVVGSIAGQPLGGDTVNYQGMAPEAKIAFIDLGYGGSDAIAPPQDLANYYFPVAYSVGARIHSDSWGSASISYDEMAADVDIFTWANKDFLPVFAAGNEGQLGSADRMSGENTVTSPATAKNCMTVGATESIQPSDAGPVATQTYIVYDMVVDMAGSHTNTFRVVQGEFGDGSTLLGTSYGLTLADPHEACNPINNGAEVAGTIVLIQRGTCSFQTKVQYAKLAGAAGALIYDNELGAYFVLGQDGTTNPGLPTFGVTRRIGLALNAAVAGGLALTATLNRPVVPTNTFENLASYSSQGPTTDGRVKPDILAPGTTISSHPGADTCHVAMMQGTSMATPVVAGAAALVRQYFVDGWYTAGKSGAGKPLNPSGALIKAVMLGGAQQMMGYEKDTGLPLDPAPSFRQGFGRLQLDKSLYLEGSPSWNLQVVDGPEIKQGDTHRYCISATGKGDVYVTLTWFDYPGMPSSNSVLVNNLDLAVRAAGFNGTLLMGNGGGITSMEDGDKINTVEQVSLVKVPAGDISIEVRGVELNPDVGGQQYALVVQGEFTGTLQSDKNPGWDGSEVKCAVGAVTINNGPWGLTNDKDITFEFSTLGGDDSAHQCELTSNKLAVAGYEGWQECSSPTVYKGLADGDYVFSVKNGENAVAMQRVFVKDTTPPQVTFPTAPSASTANQTVVIEFKAADPNPVSFLCMLSVANKAAIQGDVYNRSDTVFPLDEWKPCASPQRFHWLLPGDWSFKTNATDSAGNSNETAAEVAWKVAYEPGVDYTRIKGGPFGLTRMGVAVFNFSSLQMDAAGNVVENTAAAMQCALQSVPVGSTILTVDPTPLARSYQPCVSPYSTGKPLADGAYVFLARPTGTRRRGLLAVDPNDQLAMSVFTVDTSPPNVTITSQPGNYSATSTVQFSFSVTEEATTFECMLDGGNGTSTMEPCTSPIEYDNLDDGEYTFSLTATDAVGNTAAPINITFWVDAQPPELSEVSYTPASTTPTAQFVFSADDGTGSGVISTECRMQPASLKVPGANMTASWMNCTSPATYSDLAEGVWGFAFRATDAAGQTSTSTEYMFAYDTTPPNTTLITAPKPDAANPSTVTFTFQADDGAYGSNISHSECYVVKLSDDEYSALIGTGNETLNATPGTSGPVKVAAIEDPNPEDWKNCSETYTVQGLESGKYGFQVRSVDNANNVGEATTAYAFQVDSTLPVPKPPSDQSSSSSGMPKWVWTAAIAAGAALGGIILLSLLVCIIRRCCCGRGDRGAQYRPAPPTHHGPHTGPLPGQPLPDPQLQAAIQASLMEQQAAAAANMPLMAHSSSAGMMGVPSGEMPERDPHLLAAIQASLHDVQQQPRAQAPDETDEEYRLAIQASLEDQYMAARRRADIMSSMGTMPPVGLECQPSQEPAHAMHMQLSNHFTQAYGMNQSTASHMAQEVMLQQQHQVAQQRQRALDRSVSSVSASAAARMYPPVDGYPLQQNIMSTAPGGYHGMYPDASQIMGTHQNIMRTHQSMMGTQQNMMGTQQNMMGTQQNIMGTQQSGQYGYYDDEEAQYVRGAGQGTQPRSGRGN